MKKVLFYTNQFFGQIGGEEMAYTAPSYHEGVLGPALGFSTLLKDAEIVGTFICGVGDVNNALSGATFTVMLRLTNPNNANEYVNIETINYTFA